MKSSFILKNSLLLLVLSLYVACYGTTLTLATSSNNNNNNNRIVEENSKIGAVPEEWDINGVGDPTIQGFSTDISYQVGDTAHFKIDSSPDTDSYIVDIFRLGYYQGKGARFIERLEPKVKLPFTQPPCKVNATTGETSCAEWTITASFQIPLDAVSGYYIARPTRIDDTDDVKKPRKTWRAENSQVGADPRFAFPNQKDTDAPTPGNQKYGANKLGQYRFPLKLPRASHIYFIVRDRDDDNEDNKNNNKHDIVMQSSDTVWQAYNHFGGASTYGSYAEQKLEKALPRIFKASYNRPLSTREFRMANAPLGSEFPMIQFLERYGYDVTYISGVDTDRLGSKRLSRYNLFLSVGHDEYVSGAQRANLEEAIEIFGLNVAFLAGNEYFWRIRWEDNYRTMVVYKETQHPTKLDPNLTEFTGTHRDARDINPIGSKPENALIGQLFTFNAWRNDPLVIGRRFSSLRWWKNTKVEKMKDNPKQKYQAYLRGVLGHEMDEDVDNGFRPAGLIHLSETQIDNVMYVNDYGSNYDTGSGKHRLTLYKNRKSGAIIFAAGTCQWSWSLSGFHDSATGLPAHLLNMLNVRVEEDIFSPVRDLQQFTMNIFSECGAKPSSMLLEEENRARLEFGKHMSASDQFGYDDVTPLKIIDFKKDNEPPSCRIVAVVFSKMKIVADSENGTEIPVAIATVDAIDDDNGGIVAGVEVSIDGGKRWHGPAIPEDEEALLKGNEVSRWKVEVHLKGDLEEMFTTNGDHDGALIKAYERARCRATDDSLNTNYDDNDDVDDKKKKNSDL